MKSRNKDHKPHESIIGKIIYGFLLFMPLLAIGVTCAYAIFNKNAYQSYSASERITTFSPINNELNINKKYYFDTDSNSLTQNITQTISVYRNKQFVVNSGTIIQEDSLIDFKLHYTTANYLLIRRYDSNNNVQTIYASFSVNQQINFEFEVGSNITIDSTYNNYIKEINTNVDNYIDNVFYYSIDKVQQSPLFNWAEDSLIYTGMTNTCNALNITTPFIPLLMTYWLIISVIYILYDIILVIIHIFHKKIHQLEDSF